MSSGGGGGDQTPAPTAQERTLAGVGAEQWNDYARRYAGPGGVNEKFIQTTRTTEGDVRRVKGTVSADSAIAARQLKQDTAQVRAKRGVSSGSGASIAQGFGDVMDIASTKGRAQGVAEQSAEDAQLAADFKLASFGRGLAEESQVGLQQGVSRATSLVREDAIARAEERQQLLSAAGTGLGMYSQTKGLFKKDKPKVKTGLS